jgi:hypothetical protein
VRREKEVVASRTTTSWATQPPHEIASQPLYELLLSCNSKYFLYAPIKELYSHTKWLTRQLIVYIVCRVNPKLRINAWDGLLDDTNVLALRPSALVKLHTHPLKENIPHNHPDSYIQFQFLRTCDPLYLKLHINYPLMDPLARCI